MCTLFICEPRSHEPTSAAAVTATASATTSRLHNK